MQSVMSCYNSLDASEEQSTLEGEQGWDEERPASTTDDVLAYGKCNLWVNLTVVEAAMMMA